MKFTGSVEEKNSTPNKLKYGSLKSRTFAAEITLPMLDGLEEAQNEVLHLWKARAGRSDGEEFVVHSSRVVYKMRCEES